MKAEDCAALDRADPMAQMRARFVIPPGMATRYRAVTDDLELLEVALPGSFETQAISSDSR